LPDIGNDSVPHPSARAHGRDRRIGGMVGERTRRNGMLSAHEERIWDDVQRFWDVTAEEPATSEQAPDSPSGRASGDVDDAPVWAALGVRAAVLLLLFGAVVPGLLVTAASLVGWALWHHRRTPGPTATLPVIGEHSP
jgi:hypothetical protein